MCKEREFFIDNLMVRIHSIIKIILVTRPCAMGEIGAEFPNNQRQHRTWCCAFYEFGRRVPRAHVLALHHLT